MSELDMRNIALYIIWRTGCIHPFRISRLLVLANWRSIEEKGRVIAKFKVSGFEAGFSIDKLPEIKDDKCISLNEDRRCLEYNCEPPSIEEDYRNIIDKIIDETIDLDDISLNRMVIYDARYKKLLKKGGF